MTACTHHLWDEPTGLRCTGKHHPAHTYEASSAPDEHDKSEGRAEASRG